jgi:hypothetical protein
VVQVGVSSISPTAPCPSQAEGAPDVGEEESGEEDEGGPGAGDDREARLAATPLLDGDRWRHGDDAGAGYREESKSEDDPAGARETRDRCGDRCG